jgi:hypothetical protein
MPQCWFVTQSQTGGLYHIKLPVYLRELLVHKTGMRRHGACKLVDRFWTVFFLWRYEHVIRYTVLGILDSLL